METVNNDPYSVGFLVRLAYTVSIYILETLSGSVNAEFSLCEQFKPKSKV